MGVFLKTCDDSGCHKCLPHARGGVSQAIHELIGYGLSSPRTWGCFCRQKTFSYDSSVFPTHVGVFPNTTYSEVTGAGLPHARGGVSLAVLEMDGRLWVFPTHVGVFRFEFWIAPKASGLPHARGGVSSTRRFSSFRPMSSPRTWGCFRKSGACWLSCLVFPTHVGVFPRRGPPIHT